MTQDLAPELRAMLDDMAASGAPPLPSLSPDEARAAFVGLAEAINAKPDPGVAIKNITMEGPGGSLPLRIYTPEQPADGPLPVFLFFHGGGFIVGTLDGYDTVCQHLAAKARCIVISVDYRLAPEHKFPAALEDCLAATYWTAENAADFGGDSTRLAVGGDSAGGNLAAVVSHVVTRKDGPKLAHQVLFFPMTDCSHTYPSHETFAEGYFLSRDMVQWFFDAYARGPADAAHPLLSPLLFEDFSGLPPALLIAAGFDPLHDEGERYAARLRDAGVEVTYSCYDDMIHGFISMTAVTPRGFEALDEAAAALSYAFYD